jgi:hypothetical protein
MSLSSTVDSNYRLTSADLRGAPRRARVANVTYQGLETLTPVLHFEGQAKRLLLTPQQTRQMVEITGSAHFPTWIGRDVVLKPQQHSGSWEIILLAPAQAPRAGAIPAEQTEDQQGWRLTRWVVLILLLVSLTYTVFTYTTLVAIVQELLANFPL